jgi:hypothetical protein
LRHVIWQEFQRYKAVKPGVLGFVHHSHASGTQLFDDAVMRYSPVDQRVRIRHNAHILGCEQKASQRRESFCRLTAASFTRVARQVLNGQMDAVIKTIERNVKLI